MQQYHAKRVRRLKPHRSSKIADCGLWPAGIKLGQSAQAQSTLIIRLRPKRCSRVGNRLTEFASREMCERTELMIHRRICTNREARTANHAKGHAQPND